MVTGIRRAEAALGDGRKLPAPPEKETALLARRSLVVVADLPAGAVLRREHLAARRPGTGLPPNMLPQVVGRRVTRFVPAGTVLTDDMLGEDRGPGPSLSSTT